MYGEVYITPFFAASKCVSVTCCHGVTWCVVCNQRGVWGVIFWSEPGYSWRAGVLSE